MAEKSSKIFVILGATGSGKSNLAAALARAMSGEILSVDSMQVYRGMDIGTAKPSRQEREEIPHHLIDVVDPTEEFTVARFVESADAVLARALSAGTPVIVTGGTPLYYKALFEGLFEGPSADMDVRQRLREISGEALHHRLRSIDPEAAARIHSNDSKRLIRALEVFELTGKPISQHQTEWTAARQRHEAQWFGLRWEKEALNQRINLRVKEMIAAGWPREVRDLLSRYGQLSKTAGEATGYRQMIRHVRGEIPLADAAEEIKIATRQLARRQLKWFRRFARVNWLDAAAGTEANIQNILGENSNTPATQGEKPNAGDAE